MFSHALKTEGEAIGTFQASKTFWGEQNLWKFETKCQGEKLQIVTQSFVLCTKVHFTEIFKGVIHIFQV